MPLMISYTANTELLHFSKQRELIKTRGKEPSTANFGRARGPRDSEMVFSPSQMVPFPSLPDSPKPGLQGSVKRESNFKSNSLLEATRAILMDEGFPTIKRYG